MGGGGGVYWSIISQCMTCLWVERFLFCFVLFCLFVVCLFFVVVFLRWIHLSISRSNQSSDLKRLDLVQCNLDHAGARCSSVVRAFAHGAMYRRIDPS